MSEWNNNGDHFGLSGMQGMSIFDINLDEIDPTRKDLPEAFGFEPSLAQTRQILNLLVLVDTSGSMQGARIGKVNYALENVFKELSRQSDASAQIMVNIMEFDESASWQAALPVPLEDFAYTSLRSNYTWTAYGPAFRSLEEKLHSHGFMDPAKGEYFAPVILFITDGEPIDTIEYREALQKLQRNGWFRQSARYAIAVGENARTRDVMNVLKEFTGSDRNVRFVDEGDALVQLVEFVTVRASMVQSAMISSGPDKGDAAIDIFGRADDITFDF